MSMAALEALNEAVLDCRRCPRLVEWREQVAREKRAGVSRLGLLGPADAGLRRSRRAVLILGLAPGGARRQPDRAGSSPATGSATSCSPRCTGSGWPTRPRSIARGDGLRLTAPTSSPPCVPATAGEPADTRRSAANCAEWLEREVALLP
jgi:uracil-DNA glycosylase